MNRIRAKIRVTIFGPNPLSSEECPPTTVVSASLPSESYDRRDLVGFHWCWDPHLSNSQRVSKLLDAKETAERIWRAEICS